MLSKMSAKMSGLAKSWFRPTKWPGNQNYITWNSRKTSKTTALYLWMLQLLQERQPWWLFEVSFWAWAVLCSRFFTFGTIHLRHRKFSQFLTPTPLLSATVGIPAKYPTPLKKMMLAFASFESHMQYVYYFSNIFSSINLLTFKITWLKRLSVLKAAHVQQIFAFYQKWLNEWNFFDENVSW